MSLIPPTTPKSLKDVSNIKIRNDLLSSPHMLPLNKYVKVLREKLGSTAFVPNFDPLDGGINAEFIFLLEKPGRKTDERNGGSGFISRDNNDETAKNIFNFMNLIGLDRKRTLLWNTIPYWDGGRPFKPDDVTYGIQLLEDVLALLPQKKAVVLVGNQAQKAAKLITTHDVKILKSTHPSPITRACSYSKWEKIPNEWAEIFSKQK